MSWREGLASPIMGQRNWSDLPLILAAITNGNFVVLFAMSRVTPLLITRNNASLLCCTTDHPNLMISAKLSLLFIWAEISKQFDNEYVVLMS